MILGQRVAAVGDPRTTKELAGQTADTLPVVDVAGRSAPGSEPPQLQVSDLSAAAVAPEIASGNPTTSVASSSGGVSAGPTIEVFNAIPSAGTLTTVVVSLSVGTSVQRAGFSFELPDAIKAMGAAAEVRLLDGQPLPPWLRFDAKTQRFVAATVPMGALPLQVVVTVGGQRVLVLVREGQE